MVVPPDHGGISELGHHIMSLTHRHGIGIKFFDNVRVNVGFGGHEFAPPPTGDHLEDVGILSRRANMSNTFSCHVPFSSKVVSLWL